MFIVYNSEIRSTFENVGEEVSSVFERAEEVSELPSVGISEEATVTLEQPSEQIKVNESTIQYPAVLGKSVKWKKKISVSQLAGFNVKLPKDSENVKIVKVEFRK